MDAVRLHAGLASALLLLAAAGAGGAAEDGEFKATIARDRFGVPYILADTIADASFGDGYAQAEDRLQLLMDNILTATGTRAAALGPSEVERDYRARVSGARATAYARWKEQPAEVRQALAGFAAGINQYMQEHAASLPPSARIVEPQEILATFMFGVLYRQMQQAEQDLQGRGKDPLRGEGSNGVVLAPSRSASGKPLLLADPHTPWSGLNRWYEKHYVTPQVEAHGFNSTGLPLFMFCVTDRIAWTLTRNPGDRADSFQVKINPQMPSEYLLGDKYRPFDVREELIEVKGGKTVARKVASTVLGPVFRRNGDKAVAAGMSMFGRVGAPSQFYYALVSRNLGDFKKASAMNEGDGANILYADTLGNIFYCWWNRLHLRNDKYDWTKAVDGSSADALYRGVLPFSGLPQSVNDSGGYYQASNEADWTLPGGAWGISRDAFPRWLLTSPARTVLPARSQRVVDLIKSRPKHSLEDLSRWSLDTRILAAEWVLPLIERAYGELGNQDDPRVGQAVQVLKEWKRNPVAGKDSRGYSIYREWLSALAKQALFDPADARNILPMLPEHPERVAAKYVEATHKALVEAVEALVGRYGTPAPRWGEINVIELADGRQFPSGAADAASQGLWQNSQNPRPGKDGKWRVVGGSDALMVAEMSSPPRVRTLVPYGQSDNVGSPHFADQTARYTEGQWKSVYFTRAQILKHSKSSIAVRKQKR